MLISCKFCPCAIFLCSRLRVRVLTERKTSFDQHFEIVGELQQNSKQTLKHEYESRSLITNKTLERWSTGLHAPLYV